MKGFDYSSDNLYFVTICVKDRLCCFGEIIEETGRDLSVHNLNQNQNPDKNDAKKSNHRMKLNKFGLIVQERMEWLPMQYQYVVIHNYVVMPNHVHLVIEIDSLCVSKDIKIKSLSSLMGAFKTTSSKLIHEAGFREFAWQRSFHDSIIRSNIAHQNISNYIDMNPLKWQQDSLFSKD